MFYVLLAFSYVGKCEWICEYCWIIEFLLLIFIEVLSRVDRVSSLASEWLCCCCCSSPVVAVCNGDREELSGDSSQDGDSSIEEKISQNWHQESGENWSLLERAKEMVVLIPPTENKEEEGNKKMTIYPTVKIKNTHRRTRSKKH